MAKENNTRIDDVLGIGLTVEVQDDESYCVFQGEDMQCINLNQRDSCVKADHYSAEYSYAHSEIMDKYGCSECPLVEDYFYYSVNRGKEAPMNSLGNVLTKAIEQKGGLIFVNDNKIIKQYSDYMK